MHVAAVGILADDPQALLIAAATRPFKGTNLLLWLLVGSKKVVVMIVQELHRLVMLHHS